jgi:hypothetical protein
MLNQGNKMEKLRRWRRNGKSWRIAEESHHDETLGEEDIIFLMGTSKKAWEPGMRLGNGTEGSRTRSMA